MGTISVKNKDCSRSKCFGWLFFFLFAMKKLITSVLKKRSESKEVVFLQESSEVKNHYSE